MYTNTRNHYCNICMELVTFCSSIDVNCMYCNVVNHIACIKETECNNNDDMYHDGWICKDCTDDIQDSKDTFLMNKLKEATKIQKDNAQKMIAKHMRRLALYSFICHLYGFQGGTIQQPLCVQDRPGSPPIDSITGSGHRSDIQIH